jgi:hypothetical protein
MSTINFFDDLIEISYKIFNKSNKDTKAEKLN